MLAISGPDSVVHGVPTPYSVDCEPGQYVHWSTTDGTFAVDSGDNRNASLTAVTPTSPPAVAKIKVQVGATSAGPFTYAGKSIKVT